MPARRKRDLRTVPDAGPRALGDEDLMAEVAKDDQQAFAELYDRYADRLYGVIRKVVRDPAMSEEVAQEVFVEAWRQARRYDRRKGAVATWLMTMAHRRAIDRVRSEQASRDREDRASDRGVERPFDHTAEQVETNLEHKKVRDALGELTDLQREAIELAYYGGNTYRETAELLDAPLGTVKTRLRDGLIRLRDTLGVST
jgi:RNA polymerase sigma-70 factor (ECF subfamily)